MLTSAHLPIYIVSTAYRGDLIGPAARTGRARQWRRAHQCRRKIAYHVRRDRQAHDTRERRARGLRPLEDCAMNAITAIIADDETHLREYLRTILSKRWPELRILGEASTGAEALALIRDEEPNIAFLDIRMPVLTGLDVAARVRGACNIVFITAFDDMAVQAFEQAAVDYLIKPVEEDRLRQTIERLKARITENDAPAALDQVLNNIKARLGAAPEYLKWIKVSRNKDIELVAADRIGCFIAEDKYTTIYSEGKEMLIKKTIKELEAELNPDHFWRIHRNAIINLNHVARVERALDGRLTVHLSDVTKPLAVSRSYNHLFKAM